MGEAFLNVVQDSFHGRPGATGVVVFLGFKRVPFGAQACQSEFGGDVQESMEAGA